MKLTHLELPRHFTFTVKEFLVATAQAVTNAGHTFAQFDSNPIFWRWLLTLRTPAHVPHCWEAVLDHSDGAAIMAAIRSFQGQLDSVRRHYGLKLGPHGVELPRPVRHSTAAMQRQVEAGTGREWFARFFCELDSATSFADADLLSLGIDSAAGVFWTLQLAAWLRTQGWKGHLSIGRHSHENFSLLHTLDLIERRGTLFASVDSIVLQDEEQPAAFIGLLEYLATGRAGSLRNVSWRDGRGEIRRVAVDPDRAQAVRTADASYGIPARYFETMPVPRDQLVYAMAMCRNKCFHRRCVFCAQLAQHLSDAAYAPSSEVARALAAAAEVSCHGVHAINFSDEAMRPADLRAFARGVGDRGLEIRWVGRMIAAANPDRDLLREMRAAGCVEVLFGLESFDSQVAAALGKARRKDADAAVRLVETFTDEGIFTILSLITASPFTSERSVEIDAHCLDRLAHRSQRWTAIINPFVLFRASAMFGEPRRFGLGAVEESHPENDLQSDFTWRSASGSSMPTLLAQPDAGRFRLGLPASDYRAALQRLSIEEMDHLHHWDYCSIGLWHRIRQARTIPRECFRSAPVTDSPVLVPVASLTDSDP